MDDVVLNKAAIIERCVDRVAEVYDHNPKNLTDDPTKQDSIVLNLQRAVEACIDLAMHRVRQDRLGVPQSSRDAFDLLAKVGALETDLAERLKRMVGFRNVAVHDYQALSVVILQAVVERHLADLQTFASGELKRTRW